MGKKGKGRVDDSGLISRNKRAYYEYEILEKFEAGLALQGSEVKSLRENGATIAEAYARFRGEELWLVDATIAPFKQASAFNHEPGRPRKLLLHKRELRHIKSLLDRKGLSLVPLRLYFNARNLVKLQLGLGRGKKLHDKRDTLKKKSAQRDIERARY